MVQPLISLMREPKGCKIEVMPHVQTFSGGIYHLYNRGVDRRKIFLDDSHYRRFITSLEHILNFNYPYSLLTSRLRQAKTPATRKLILEELELYRIEPGLEIFAFCLMPNHYHLLCRQIKDQFIPKFIQKLAGGYTKYFNIRNRRSGRLFESSYKMVPVKSNEQLIHLSRYQHLNPQPLLETIDQIINYPWSSLSTYLGNKNNSFVKPEMVLSNFASPEKYKDFVFAEIDDVETYTIVDVAVDDDFGWFKKHREQRDYTKQKLREQAFHASLSQQGY